MLFGVEPGAVSRFQVSNTRSLDSSLTPRAAPARFRYSLIIVTKRKQMEIAPIEDGRQDRGIRKRQPKWDFSAGSAAARIGS